ncbi:hypothetical protein NW768_002869 [Fusarium equiseti]|uniref:Uncharacterized protein n=1 Tax=Fusarium equiseti TaxID=61235 RepID=A0ABQ8RKI4_FUSEQ|nr:hypothetical protein NW768_002869 [Fusarium equiseti]
MTELKVSIHITSRYRVFDKSGKLPYSVAFGLCRRSSNDKDHRSLRLSANNSILDVPYALSHGLLSLCENDVEIDTGHLRSTDGNEPYLTLPSPVGRTGNWRNHLSIYYYHISPDSDLGRLFKPGNKYHIRNKTGGDLRGDYVYVDNFGQSSRPSEKQKLVSSKAYGGARFKVVQCLPWPPEVQTRMQIHKAEDNAPVLEITVINNGNEPISVQTRYIQRFLTPNNPLQQNEEVPTLDPRPRIIDPKTPGPASTIQIVDMATGQVVSETRKPGPCGGAATPRDIRPKLEILTTLRPGQPLVRHVDVRYFAMYYQTKTFEVCDRCGGTSVGSYGPVTPCGRRGRGPLTQIDDNTEEPCNGVEVNEEEASIDMCHNCHILEELEARDREREQNDESDDEDMEEVYIP